MTKHSIDPTTTTPELLSGRRALIAGGTGNVGRVVAGAFLAAGATVVVPSRSAGKLDGLRKGLGDPSDDRLITLVGDIGDERDAGRVRDAVTERVGSLDAVVASLGDFVPAPSVLDARGGDLRRALDGYLLAHFVVARSLMPVLEARAGSYTFINGPLAFDPVFPGSGLVSVATAGQAMLARTVMKETAEGDVRVNEVVIYSRFAGGEDQKPVSNPVSRGDVGRYLALLASPRGAHVRGQAVHLDTREPLRALA